MSTDTSLHFAEALRETLDLLGRIVWDSHQLGIHRDGEWPESEFFASLVNQGFGGLDPRAHAALAALALPGSYRISFECVRHNQQKMEPITGADLGVVVTVLVNGQGHSRRGFLVQLKKGTKREGKKAASGVQFDDLHHESGAKFFGRELHQAERMLLFTSSAVYWLAVPPGADSDKKFFDKYVVSTNLATRRTRRASAAEYPNMGGEVVSPLVGRWALLPWMDLDPGEFDYMLRRWERFVGRPLGLSAQAMGDEHRLHEGERLIRMLRADAAAESRRLYGMKSLTPVMAAHAESVLALRPHKVRALSEVYDHAVSLPEFILGDVVADGFGDDNADFVEAILENKPNEFIWRIVRSCAPTTDGDDQAVVAKDVVKVEIAVDAGPRKNQG
jgi:hypothetical protein